MDWEARHVEIVCFCLAHLGDSEQAGNLIQKHTPGVCVLWTAWFTGGEPVEKTYKIIDVVGVSEESVQQAVRNALKKASQTLRNIDWFEVTDIRGLVKNNSEPVFQVSIKLGFRLEDQSL